MPRPGYVYIMASRRNGTLYLGVTSDLPKRVFEHRIGAVPGFSRQYGCRQLVWYAVFEDIQDAPCPRAADEEVEAELEASGDRGAEP